MMAVQARRRHPARNGRYQRLLSQHSIAASQRIFIITRHRRPKAPSTLHSPRKLSSKPSITVSVDSRPILVYSRHLNRSLSQVHNLAAHRLQRLSLHSLKEEVLVHENVAECDHFPRHAAPDGAAVDFCDVRPDWPIKRAVLEAFRADYEIWVLLGGFGEACVCVGVNAGRIPIGRGGDIPEHRIPQDCSPADDVVEHGCKLLVTRL
jgi:hypothetical protein